MTRDEAVRYLAKKAFIQPRGRLDMPSIVIGQRFSEHPVDEFLVIGGSYVKITKRNADGPMRQWYLNGQDAIDLMKEMEPNLWGFRKANAATWEGWVPKGARVA